MGLRFAGKSFNTDILSSYFHIRVSLNINAQLCRAEPQQQFVLYLHTVESSKQVVEDDHVTVD